MQKKGGMRKMFEILIVVFIIGACSEKEVNKYPIKQSVLKSHKASIDHFDHLMLGKTYLPVYSHIYHIYENRTFDLTVTVSIRNVSMVDSVYILKADYYNTSGDNIRNYLESPICIKPLETVEIIIAEQDVEGGSGANFMFDWAAKDGRNPPLFEAVMISTSFQQGLSFSTRGIIVNE